jgi:hypothetical protein
MDNEPGSHPGSRPNRRDGGHSLSASTRSDRAPPCMPGLPLPCPQLLCILRLLNRASQPGPLLAAVDAYPDYFLCFFLGLGRRCGCARAAHEKRNFDLREHWRGTSGRRLTVATIRKFNRAQIVHTGPDRGRSGLLLGRHHGGRMLVGGLMTCLFSSRLLESAG